MLQVRFALTIPVGLVVGLLELDLIVSKSAQIPELSLRLSTGFTKFGIAYSKTRLSVTSRGCDKLSWGCEGL